MSKSDSLITKVLVQDLKGKTCKIRLYKPVELNLELKNHRPEFNEKIFLCIPAAYRTPKNQIDGLFIKQGIEISETNNPQLTGACIISNNGVRIIDFEEINIDLLEKVKESKQSFFQQSLLIENARIIPCAIFAERKNVRRALIQFEDYYCIGESDTPLTIYGFQQGLLEIGAKDAINLDMGTWSEGWYKDSENKKVIIGENMKSTHRQTNWLIYESK
jgi:hypothetical protein